MTVGETLSHARRERGLSVADVAAATRIRASLIEAIEADHFEPCGGTVYARGHIRSIAKLVGVDPAEVLGEFDRAHHVEAPEHVLAAVAAGPTDHEAVARSERRRPNWTMAMVAALVVICGLALAGALTSHGSRSPNQRANQSPSVTGQQHPNAHPSGPASPPPSSVAQLPNSRATMLIRANSAQTWLSITTKSGHTLFQGLLGAGQHKVFTDRHGLAYVIGNAPAVDVVVNGTDIGSPPSSGSVARGSVLPGKTTVQQA